MRPDPRTSGRRAPAHRRGRRGRRHQCRPVDRRRRRPFFEAAKAYLGAIDIAVINAAIPASALADSGESEARYQLDTDLTAYLICAQEAARCMSAGSDIVFIGSMSAVSKSPGSSIYVAAKSDRKIVVEGKSVVVRVDQGGRRVQKKKN